ncbi:MAG: biotin--[acetyl-CoA-carboxylase] ligase [Dissulfurimicrobium sp.]|uniref:biotin--[acetyl-CoA-carboxylase] ligase n=1 Tax=Dissulfurimicrobium TaxID=1769732 RepID=UPI001EDB6D3A|nr:biotin--[acetyl-CoA-carboxylase] ligase [Dissulfurimicrobium hydrothermale]UKL13440.1 biotin--[acetyl-CoA-carboxylase] ligase [Dissulfurimicrobium hydrothermale]
MSRNEERAAALKRLIDCYMAQDVAIMSSTREDAVELASRAKDIVGREIICLERAPRLMPLAKEAILRADETGLSHPSGCIWWAESLAQAKGRMGRQWWSPAGGIYLCIAIYPRLSKQFWSFYSLGIGVAITQVLREWGLSSVSVRWINDVLVHGKKVAGTLTEVITCPGSSESYILFGIGLNINIEAFPSHLPQAASLLTATKRPWPAVSLAAHLLSRIGLVFADLHKWELSRLDIIDDTWAPNPVLRAFVLASDTIGRRCVFGFDADNAPEFVATAVGVTDDGGLLLALDDGEEVTVNTGEIRYLDLP